MLTSGARLKKIVESLRDWGRDCWCQPGTDNTCGKRFDWTKGELPAGYDHKYTYSHIGYNLKATDMQAAIGVSQLDKLEGFHTARRRNFDYLKAALKPAEEWLILPQATPRSDPSWFGFPLTVREESPSHAMNLYASWRKHGLAPGSCSRVTCSSSLRIPL